MDLLVASEHRRDFSVGPYALPASLETVARELISDLQIPPFLYAFSPKHRISDCQIIWGLSAVDKCQILIIKLIFHPSFLLGLKKLCLERKNSLLTPTLFMFQVMHLYSVL